MFWRLINRKECSFQKKFFSHRKTPMVDSNSQTIFTGILFYVDKKQPFADVLCNGALMNVREL